ncbi:DedA family protein/thiosulfate sulfurtransferase GlpE [Burkholderia sp. S171]|uniref:DedA family protein/thiosulfate sulfurtransferase GlpE n=1 Tax=Burkholderia sp. S171 TaxID=1641860 RepID=UPI00131D70D8|nr:DedA family protein/thiosulfate sulfurtransferase GlpE [Burkholderia sp. S171]
MLLHDLADRYGPAIVFFNVMGAALGLPVPAMPTLIVVGASVAMMGVNGQALLPHLALMLGIATLGGVLGDLVWFQGGRRYGDRTLKTICKLSLSRDTCVKKTERFFGQWGVRVLLVAKFIPGLSLVSVPLAGAMGVRMRSFIAHDGVGVALWAAVGLAVGVVFAAELDMVFAMIARLGKQALLVVAIALAFYVAYRYWRRKMLMKTLETARITVDELYALMENQPLPAIFDIRSAEKRVLDPFVIPGSVFADERELQKIVESYQPDQKIIIYCSCPNEVSAAWMAKALRNAGFKDVVPLTGGLDAWRLAGLDLKPLTDFGGAREDLGEMAAMCPWPAKAPAADKGALHDAVYLHGDRHA